MTTRVHNRRPSISRDPDFGRFPRFLVGMTRQDKRELRDIGRLAGAFWLGSAVSVAVISSLTL